MVYIQKNKKLNFNCNFQNHQTRDLKKNMEFNNIVTNNTSKIKYVCMYAYNKEILNKKY